jgi:hypothetical protein
VIDTFLDQILEFSGELKIIIRKVFMKATRIQDLDYKKANLEEVIKNIPHLTKEHKGQVCTLLYWYEPLFKGKLGLYGICHL